MATKAKSKKIKGLSIDGATGNSAGVFVKAVGQNRSRSGKLQPARHYLGSVSDGATAAFAMLAIVQTEWEAIKAAGGSEWPTGQPFCLQPPETAAAPAMAVTPQNAGGSVSVAAISPTAASMRTVQDVSDAYTQAIYERSKANQCTIGHYLSSRAAIKQALTISNLSALPIRQLDQSRLLTAILAICSRPTCHSAHNAKTIPTKPLAIITAKNYLKALKMFLLWADDMRLWQRPPGFASLFKQNEPQKRPNEIRAAAQKRTVGAPDTFTVAELATIYAAADQRQRLLMALALNCGFAAAESASLKIWEIDLTGKPFIERERGKTGVSGKWYLWQETAALLKTELDRAAWLRTDPSDDLALLTLAGKPLVEFEGDTKRDAVASGWKHLYRSLQIRFLSFKYLRKTGASIIRQSLGYTPHDAAVLADMFLSHSDGSEMLAAYAGRDWEALHKATDALRQHLQPMFAAADKADREVVEKSPDMPYAEWRRRAAIYVRQLRFKVKHGGSKLDADALNGFQVALQQEDAYQKQLQTA